MKRQIFKIVAVICCCTLVFSLQAQNICFETEQKALRLPDSVMIVPSSILVRTQGGSSADFDYDNYSGLLNVNLPDSSGNYTICFNYLLKSSTLAESPLSSSLYDSTVLFKDKAVTDSKLGTSTKEALGMSALAIDGAFMRSVSAGQQQSVFMHSVMDLSISGKISEDLMLEARLTDQQMPFEPEGNTQRLQDFDRVNVKIKHKSWQLQGGDLLMNSAPDSYFLRYNRQVQGIGISSDVLSIDSAQSHTEAITSFSRSKTGMQLIEPIEGVLGPYRIKGPQNEPFIFLLAGSERVYLDGQLLQRGIENDYVIDYNAAELTFNANSYINKFSRIQVEFEYSDQQYARNVSAVKHEQSFERLKVRTTFFQEADLPGRALYDLSFSDMEALSVLEAGAEVGEIPAFDSIGFSRDKILYARKDTLYNGETLAVFSFSKDPQTAVYQVYFSHVGENKGDYIISDQSENAVIYEWIAPQNGIPQGNYAAMKKVALPKKQRVMTLGADYIFKNKDVISIDFASSEKTLNSFNPQGSKHIGNALSMQYASSPKSLDFGNKLMHQYTLSYEYLDSAFLPVQVFRSTEFNRNWGAEESAAYQAGQEHLIGIGTKVTNSKQSLNYQSYWRNKENFGKGHQHLMSYGYEGDLSLKSSVFFMQNQNVNYTQWVKTYANVSYKQWELVPGYKFQREKHEVALQDSLLSSFINFSNHQLYLSRLDTSRWNFRLSHDFRADYHVIDSDFALFERSQTTQLTSSLKYGTGSVFNVGLLRRTIEAAQESSQSEDFYQGNVRWSTVLWNGNIVQNLYYQTGTGRVLERNYFFREVARRMGTHSWSDLNGNGEQELNEFFEDQTEYGDRNFIKVLTMGDDYQTAFINTARYHLQLKMPSSWRKSGGLLGLLGKFSSQLQANLETKNIFSSWKDRMSPFMSNKLQEEVLSGKQYLKVNFFYNRGGRASLDVGLTESDRKQLLMNGFEGSAVKTYHMKAMLNQLSAWNFMANYYLSQHTSFSEVVSERDFNYSAQVLNPELHWQGTKNWRTVLSYKIQKKESLDEVIGGSVGVDQVTLSNKYIRNTGGIFEGKIGFVKVSSQLENDFTPLAYEMFEGLRAGKNYVWNLSVRQKIIGDLNLVIEYGGRKASDSPTVHNGSVQLSALF